MKKIQQTTRKFLVAIISMLLLISACTKKTIPTPTPVPIPKPEITPIKTTESQSVYYERYTENTISSSLEHGITFSANVKGKITKVGGKVHKAGNYRITVWDDSSKAIITTVYADLDSNSYKYVNITPIEARVDKRFVISMNVLKTAFRIVDNTGAEFMPFYTGGITIHYYCDAKTASQIFPERHRDTYRITGLVDFVFVED
ncbi:MAG: hypothetical protein KA174_09840 [Chitinophagales bacterium]|nr:hypothetical protein [Chitinophagales bacterium]